MKKGILIYWTTCYFFCVLALAFFASSVSANTLSSDEQIAKEKAETINQINQTHESVKGNTKNSTGPTSFPSTHPSSGYIFDQWACFDFTFNIYIWREDGYMWIEIEPTSEDYPSICSSSFAIIQNNIQYDTVKLETISGSSQCGNLYTTSVFWLTQWSFYDNRADLDQGFTLYYNFGEVHSIDIPGSEDYSCGDYNSDGVVDFIDLNAKRRDLFNTLKTDFTEWKNQCWIPEMGKK